MMENEKQLDTELGQALGRMRGTRFDATKDLYFETDPQTAAIRYPYDPRSMQILGWDRWHARFGETD